MVATETRMVGKRVVHILLVYRAYKYPAYYHTYNVHLSQQVRIQTGMHTSRKRTDHSLPYRDFCQGGLCLCPGGLSVREQNDDASKNITLPQTSFAGGKKCSECKLVTIPWSTVFVMVVDISVQAQSQVIANGNRNHRLGKRCDT